jgi:signal transduction histidine kinase
LRLPEIPADRSEIEGWIDPHWVRLVTLAPELPGVLDLIAALVRRGISVGQGHSNATYFEAEMGVEAGARWTTHLFSAMRELHHREPGIAGAALADKRVRVALIPDGIHVHPALLSLVAELKGPDGVTLISDGMAASGMPPGHYNISRQDVIVDETSAHLADGRLAGSVILLERPIGITTLMRSLEVAMNSRRRQYQVRDLMEEQRRAELELRQAHEQLADRARQLKSLVELRTAKLAKSNEQLRREIAERRQAEAAREVLRRQLLGAQEEERRRIARELHDQMGQNLTALNVGLKSLLDTDRRSDKLRSIVRPLQELATQTARDLHRVALELRPAALDDLGLVKAVRNLTETWSIRCGIEVDLEASRYRSTGISPEIETTIYRIIQEALNNVAKHSGAKRVSLVLSRTTDNVQAIIEDDGCGFDVTRASSTANDRGGLGLLGIQERLGNVGGNLNVESVPRRGVTLIVRIPVSKEYAKKEPAK